MAASCLPALRMAAAAGATAAVLVVAAAVPARADPAVPTNYRSVVTAVEPPLDNATLKVVGGDAFLRLTVREGHTAVAYGYGRGGTGEEPYLTVEADGTVLANVNSPAFYLNDDRYAAVDPPARADVDAEPAWRPVGTDGSYTWHDHRIHWMSPAVPPAVRARSGRTTEVFTWELPLTVDDTRHTATGRLVWVPDRSPVLPAGLVAVVLAGLLVAGRHSRRHGAPAAVGIGALGATVLLAGELLGAIDVGGGAVAAGVLVAVAVATGLVGAVRSRSTPPAGGRLLAVSGAATAVFAVQRVGVLTKPVLPTALPAEVAMALMVAALAGALAALALTARTVLRGTPVRGIGPSRNDDEPLEGRS